MLYQKLLEDKENGNWGIFDNFEHLNYESVKELLDETTVEQIASLYEVEEERVWELNRLVKLVGDTVKQIQCQDIAFNKKYKNKIWKSENLEQISKSLVHFIYRSGPVEDILAGKAIEILPTERQVSASDLSMLTSYLSDRLAYVLKLILENRWFEFFFLINTYKLSGCDWDKPDLEKVRQTLLEEGLDGSIESGKSSKALKSNKTVNAITNFIFLNGPIAEMHAGSYKEYSPTDSQLSDDDMKRINKYMMDRLTYVFSLIMKEKWDDFNGIVRKYYNSKVTNYANPKNGEKQNLNLLGSQILWDKRREVTKSN